LAGSSRKRQGELLRRLFEILEEKPDGMRAKDALQALASSVTLTEYEQGTYKAGQRRFENVVRFATLGPQKAGWLSKIKGRWSLTDTGKSALHTYSDPVAFVAESDRLYRVWASAPPRAQKESGESEVEAAETQIAGGPRRNQTFEEAEEEAWDEIESFLAAMPPYEVQDLVGSLLTAMGYHVRWISPPGKDGGIDILAFSDPLGTKPPRIKVQVKRTDKKTTSDGLRSFLALIGDDDVGIFVNTGGFTRDAEDEARTQQKRRVTLIDAERLFDLWSEFYPKLDDAARARLPIKPIYFLAPQD
jgi:restriction system protein